MAKSLKCSDLDKHSEPYFTAILILETRPIDETFCVGSPTSGLDEDGPTTRNRSAQRYLFLKFHRLFLDRLITWILSVTSLP